MYIEAREPVWAGTGIAVGAVAGMLEDRLGDEGSAVQGRYGAFFDERQSNQCDDGGREQLVDGKAVRRRQLVCSGALAARRCRACTGGFILGGGQGGVGCCSGVAGGQRRASEFEGFGQSDLFSWKMLASLYNHTVCAGTYVAVGTPRRLAGQPDPSRPH